MKKVLLGCFLFLCLFLLVACEKPMNSDGNEVGGSDDNKDTTTENQKYFDEVIEVIEKLIPNEVSEDVNLINEYEFEDGAIAAINWQSSNPDTITKRGSFFQNLFDETITLTANIEIYFLLGDPETKTHTIDVVTKGSENLEEYIALIESKIPDFVYKDFELVTKDLTFRYQNVFGYITYESMSPDILTSDGKYVNTNKEDQVVDFNYTISIKGIVIKGSKKITVEGKKDEYYIEQASLYLDEYFRNIDTIFDKIELPKTDNNGRVDFTWKSSDLTVLSNDGELLTYEPNKKAKLIATIVCNEKTSTWEKEFKTYDEKEFLDFIVNRMHRDVVQQFNMRVYAYTAENYGFIPFYSQDVAMKNVVESTTENNAKINYLTGESNELAQKLNLVTGLKPWTSPGRPTTKRTSTDFITIHDTGDAINDASWWNEYVSSGDDKRETSWHFTIGDTVLYQHVPLDEVAWHAGDGSAKFGLNDTGVIYEGPNPEITLGSDNYLYINGKKSKIPVPRIYNSNQPEYNGKPANFISPAGIYTERGKNGNYYMAAVHASNYSQNVTKFYVCTNGGNRNSVGIETCINKGVDYNQVMRNTANLVGKLLVYYDLTPERVLHHQHFSGKLCPQVMIENEMLNNFHNVIENEYIIAKYFEGITFKYQSNNPDILSNDGKILKAVNNDTTVSYKVVVTYKGETKEYELITTIKAI